MHINISVMCHVVIPVYLNDLFKVCIFHFVVTSMINLKKAVSDPVSLNFSQALQSAR